MDSIRELTDVEIRLGFAALCVESAARRVGCSYREMYRRLHRVGLINDFALRYYDVNHTESREVVTDRILECLGSWEEHQGISLPVLPKGGAPC